MIKINGHTPIMICCDIISQYIAKQKGVLVQVLPPVGTKQEELFIQALNIACAYFDITL